MEQTRHILYENGCLRTPPQSYKGDHPSDFETLTPEEKEALLYWIQQSIHRTQRQGKYQKSSYALKHDFEKEAFYVTNGQFKGAMLLCGHPPLDYCELNWDFLIVPRIKRESRNTLEYIEPSIYSLGQFDKHFARLLMKVTGVL